MEIKGQIFVLLMVIGIFFPFTFLCNFPVKASQLTTVTLELQEEPVEVDVSPGSPGIFEVEGTVTCKKWGPDTVEVFLIGSSDTGGASVEPPNLVFDGISGTEETKSFSVSTRVPMGFTSSATPTITVSGTYDQGVLKYSIPPASQMIVILQYYKIEMDVDNKEVTVKSGENAKIEFVVVNVGNGDDIFEIDFENREYLQSKGFKLPAPFKVQMAEDENKTISLDIGAPEDKSGGFVAEISILSKGSLSSDVTVKEIKPIHLKVTSSFSEQIGSFITSPLMIVIIIVILVAVFLKLKRREKITSNVN
jgi:hypothetical protein